MVCVVKVGTELRLLRADVEPFNEEGPWAVLAPYWLGYCGGIPVGGLTGKNDLVIGIDALFVDPDALCLDPDTVFFGITPCCVVLGCLEITMFCVGLGPAEAKVWRPCCLLGLDGSPLTTLSMGMS